MAAALNPLTPRPSCYHIMFNTPAQGSPNSMHMLSGTGPLSEQDVLQDMKDLADDLANKDKLSGSFRDDLHKFTEVGHKTTASDVLQPPEQYYHRISTSEVMWI